MPKNTEIQVGDRVKGGEVIHVLDGMDIKVCIKYDRGVIIWKNVRQMEVDGDIEETNKKGEDLKKVIKKADKKEDAVQVDEVEVNLEMAKSVPDKLAKRQKEMDGIDNEVTRACEAVLKPFWEIEKATGELAEAKSTLARVLKRNGMTSVKHAGHRIYIQQERLVGAKIVVKAE